MAEKRAEDAAPHANDAHRAFERIRGALLGLSYRMLGSRTEAEDAVQDTFVRWQEADRTGIRDPPAWLTMTCTRRCIDLLRRAERNRLDYVGAWLPEAVHTPSSSEDQSAIPLAASLSTAFLLMLQRLSSQERAAYLLHDIFELSYPRIAETLGLNEAACRKLVSRARTRIGEARLRADPPPLARQQELLLAFRDAIETGNTDAFAAMLSDDIEIKHDSGGKVPAAIHVLHGKKDVVQFVRKFLHRVWKKYKWTVVDLNGTRAVLLDDGGVIVTAVTIGFGGNDVATHVYILRNPDKLASLSMTSIEPGLDGLA